MSTAFPSIALAKLEITRRFLGSGDTSGELCVPYEGVLGFREDADRLLDDRVGQVWVGCSLD